MFAIYFLQSTLGFQSYVNVQEAIRICKTLKEATLEFNRRKAQRTDKHSGQGMQPLPQKLGGHTVRNIALYLYYFFPAKFLPCATVKGRLQS